MNSIGELIQAARKIQASDIHLESGMQIYVRIDGKIKNLGPGPSYDRLRQWTADLLGSRFETLKVERSIDLSETIGGARCRIHIFYSSRGLSYAIRILAQVQPTLAGLNLHPNLEKIVHLKHGLVLISGPTGSGKSTTMAALIHEINTRKNVNIVTLEQPIEYFHPNQNSLIRQREVGRDTPTFEKGMVDALREDPDVIMVGELRDRETIQLTLTAAETGHLVLATLHAATVPEAIQRILGSFPAEIRDHTADQLAQVLQVVVCQTLVLIPKFEELAPICELFFTTTAAKAKIRNGEIASIPDTYYPGTEFGCLTREKYRQWLETKPKLVKLARTAAPMVAEERVPDQVLQERYQAVTAPARGTTGVKKADVYTIDEDEGDDDLLKAIEDLEK